MPKKNSRAEPGTTGEGEYFRIIVRPKRNYNTFRYHDVGKSGHIQRLAGKTKNGSWNTQAWLISKNDAHIESGRLIPDTKDAKELIDRLGSYPVHAEKDIFRAKDVPSSGKSIKPNKSPAKPKK